jgi:hypothetical protein
LLLLPDEADDTGDELAVFIASGEHEEPIDELSIFFC